MYVGKHSRIFNTRLAPKPSEQSGSKRSVYQKASSASAVSKRGSRCIMSESAAEARGVCVISSCDASTFKRMGEADVVAHLICCHSVHKPVIEA